MSRYTMVPSKEVGLSGRGSQCLSTFPFNPPIKSSHCITYLPTRCGEKVTTSDTRQGAKEKLEEIIKGKNHGRWFDGAKSIPQQQQRLLSEETCVGHQVHQPTDNEALLEWDDLLNWQQDNEFIITSYRRATFSYRNSLKSVFRIHNETVNIWSHIIGVLAFLYAIGELFTGGIQVEMKDELAVLTYFISVIVCFSFSFIYHIFLDHSHTTRTWTSRFDYLGIVIPLWGTTMASVHFGFHCEPGLRKAHFVFATCAGIVCAITTLHPSFTGTACKGFRTGAYVLLGLSYFLPIVQGVRLFGWHQMEQRMSLSYYIALGICHATGAIMYACRIPERWCPRRYDVVGSSHQIMHVLVVCGAVAYGLGVLKAREHWRGSGCASIL